MTHIKFDVLKAETKINNNLYPLFTGFLKASTLIEIAEVPSFSTSKPHHRIADDVIDPPIDEWQRPEDANKIQKIKEIYGDNQKDNLMANPVLLGTAIQNLNSTSVSISISQKTVKSSTGEIIPIENYYEVNVEYLKSAKRPIWILDGQHRIKGLSISKQKDELVPFVLLHDTTKYTPPFLAEIFTHVTTGAKPMEAIHGEWMKFAFSLDHFKESSYKLAMQATVFLCKEPVLDSLANPFSNQIQFNPYITPAPKWYSFEFNAIEWENLIAINYYGKGGKLSPKNLAEEICKSTIAFKELDTHADNDSKLFSNNKPHKILAEAYIVGLLSFLVKNLNRQTFLEWKSFYLEPSRAVNKCNFSLSYIKTPGALSSNNGSPSKKVAINSFIDFFNNPFLLNGHNLTDYLQGIGGEVTITSFKKSDNGKVIKNSIRSVVIPFAKGTTPYDLSAGGIERNFIKIQSSSSNIYIHSAKDGHYKPAKTLNEILKSRGEDISSFENNYEIEVECMAYSGDTRKVLEIRLDK